MAVQPLSNIDDGQMVGRDGDSEIFYLAPARHDPLTIELQKCHRHQHGSATVAINKWMIRDNPKAHNSL